MNRSDKFYTIEEATDILGISEHEIMNMITLQKLHAVQIEKTIRIREEDMEKFLDSLGRADNATVDNTKDEPGMAAETKRIDGEDDEIRNEYKLQEGDGVTENDFDNDMEIGGDINNMEEDEENEEDEEDEENEEDDFD